MATHLSDADVENLAKPGYNHICFAVTDLDAEVKRLTSWSFCPVQRVLRWNWLNGTLDKRRTIRGESLKKKKVVTKTPITLKGHYMDTSFWHKKWEDNDIAFHERAPNPLLVKYFNRLSLVKGSRVFVPLCGKTLDIPWLLSNRYRVAGAELSNIAIEQLFAGLGVEPTISRIGGMDHYSANTIDLFVGDIFDLTSKMLGSVDAIYDRAALVALPETMRIRYTAHLTEITDNAPQLLICYEYDQSLLHGPPFSINNEEVHQHYRKTYEVSLLASISVPGGLKGKCAASENVWLLRKA